MRGLMLPLGARSLVLPNVAVAELVGFQEPVAEPDAPDWLLGSIQWRGRRIPLVSFNAALGGDATEMQGRRKRIAIVNTLSGNPQLPYIGLLTVGISRLVRIRADNLVADPEGEVESALLLDSLTVAGQPAWIPDLDRLEQMVGSAQAA
jgi:chemosensory pili system protein ChpC